MTIIRYSLNPHEGEVGMEPDATGEYVLASDYDEMLATNLAELAEAWTLLGRAIPLIDILRGNKEAVQLAIDLRNYALEDSE